MHLNIPKINCLRIIFKLLTLTLIWVAISVPLSTAKASDAFVFTAIPDQDESQLEKRFGVVALYLEEQLGVPVKYVPVKSYAAAVTAFRNGQVQLAWFGGLSGVQARRLVAGSEAIAQGVEDQPFCGAEISTSTPSAPMSTQTQPEAMQSSTISAPTSCAACASAVR